MAEAKTKLTVPVDPGTFFDVIRDYEAYPDFLSTVESAEVLERTKKSAVVKFTARVIKPFSYTLELTEVSPKKLTWTLREGDFMKKNEGSWTLKSKGKNSTEAIYEIEVELSRLVPSMVTSVLLKESLPKTMEEFKKRAVGKK